MQPSHPDSLSGSASGSDSASAASTNAGADAGAGVDARREPGSGTDVPGVGTAEQIVDDPAEITPAWMTAALRGAGGAHGAGGAGDVEVRAVSHEPIGTGQIGSSYRFRLEYAPGRDTTAGGAPAPRTLVVKMGAGDPGGRDVVRRGYRKEVGFYARLARDARIDIPHCWQAAISPDSRAFTLVLADAAPARPGSQEDGCDEAQATDAVRALAGLHASFWNSELLAAEGDWLPRPQDAELAFMAELLVATTKDFGDRFAGVLDQRDLDTLHRAAALTYQWESGWRAPFTLLHGDYRLDNLMFPAQGPGVLTVDWQTITIGLPARDLAYFLSTALPPAVRRSTEHRLVGAYHARLVELGVTGYSAEQCFTDYRAGMLHGPLITVLGCMFAAGVRSERSDRMFLSMARGICAALRDLESLDLIASS
ncbi:aminoglycoside phosphotransferase [Parafrankia sp. EUN1f]|nr:aminoglycoside phosphotransferase [Parafrankia sp. EUN1f]